MRTVLAAPCAAKPLRRTLVLWRRTNYDEPLRASQAGVLCRMLHQHTARTPAEPHYILGTSAMATRGEGGCRSLLRWGKGAGTAGIPAYGGVAVSTTSNRHGVASGRRNGRSNAQTHLDTQTTSAPRARRAPRAAVPEHELVDPTRRAATVAIPRTPSPSRTRTPSHSPTRTRTDIHLYIPTRTAHADASALPRASVGRGDERLPGRARLARPVVQRPLLCASALVSRATCEGDGCAAAGADSHHHDRCTHFVLMQG
ncbi:hypothetical protein FB451DRAFT_1394663 [Mycena latifolia]|nr:hypothetical protein FB451DRAFT_1394663 [Mycena latifolia]